MRLSFVCLGSSNILNALLTRCASKNKVAICSYRPRSVSGPCYVALLPQLEVGSITFAHMHFYM